MVITGGEPLLVNDLPELLRAISNAEITIVLSTNGLLLESRLDRIAPWLSWVALPLDADNPEVNQAMRFHDPRCFSSTLKLIPILRKRYPSLKIKLGTVICKINLGSVLGIPQLVTGARKPDIWKLYQVSYSNYGKDNKKMVEITEMFFTS